MVDGVLLAVGGEDQGGSRKTTSIYGFHHNDGKWKHVGDMPFQCSWVDTLLVSGGLLVVDGGSTQQVLKMTVEGKYCCTGIELMRLFSGLAKLFPITPSPNKAEKSGKEADERYGEYVGIVKDTEVSWS